MPNRHCRLPEILEGAAMLAARLEIPVRMVSAHRELRPGRNQQ